MDATPRADHDVLPDRRCRMNPRVLANGRTRRNHRGRRPRNGPCARRAETAYDLGEGQGRRIDFDRRHRRLGKTGGNDHGTGVAALQGRSKLRAVRKCDVARLRVRDRGSLADDDRRVPPNPASDRPCKFRKLHAHRSLLGRDDHQRAAVSSRLAAARALPGARSLTRPSSRVSHRLPAQLRPSGVVLVAGSFSAVSQRLAQNLRSQAPIPRSSPAPAGFVTGS